MRSMRAPTTHSLTTRSPLRQCPCVAGPGSAVDAVTKPDSISFAVAKGQPGRLYTEALGPFERRVRRIISTIAERLGKGPTGVHKRLLGMFEEFRCSFCHPRKYDRVRQLHHTESTPLFADTLSILIAVALNDGTCPWCRREVKTMQNQSPFEQKLMELVRMIGQGPEVNQILAIQYLTALISFDEGLKSVLRRFEVEKVLEEAAEMDSGLGYLTLATRRALSSLVETRVFTVAKQLMEQITELRREVFIGPDPKLINTLENDSRPCLTWDIDPEGLQRGQIKYIVQSEAQMMNDLIKGSETRFMAISACIRFLLDTDQRLQCATFWEIGRYCTWTRWLIVQPDGLSGSATILSVWSLLCSSTEHAERALLSQYLETIFMYADPFTGDSTGLRDIRWEWDYFFEPGLYYCISRGINAQSDIGFIERLLCRLMALMEHQPRLLRQILNDKARKKVMAWLVHYGYGRSDPERRTKTSIKYIVTPVIKRLLSAHQSISNSLGHQWYITAHPMVYEVKYIKRQAIKRVVPLEIISRHCKEILSAFISGRCTGEEISSLISHDEDYRDELLRINKHAIKHNTAKASTRCMLAGLLEKLTYSRQHSMSSSSILFGTASDSLRCTHIFRMMFMKTGGVLELQSVECLVCPDARILRWIDADLVDKLPYQATYLPLPIFTLNHERFYAAATQSDFLVQLQDTVKTAFPGKNVDCQPRFVSSWKMPKSGYILCVRKTGTEHVQQDMFWFNENKQYLTEVFTNRVSAVVSKRLSFPYCCSKYNVAEDCDGYISHHTSWDAVAEQGRLPSTERNTSSGLLHCAVVCLLRSDT